MSAGVPLPKVIFGHGFVLAGGGRMSKSMGNVMDPVATAELLGEIPTESPVTAIDAEGVELGRDEAWERYRAFSFQTLMVAVTSIGLGSSGTSSR